MAEPENGQGFVTTTRKDGYGDSVPGPARGIGDCEGGCRFESTQIHKFPEIPQLTVNYIAFQSKPGKCVWASQFEAPFIICIQEAPCITWGKMIVFVTPGSNADLDLTLTAFGPTGPQSLAQDPRSELVYYDATGIVADIGPIIGRCGDEGPVYEYALILTSANGSHSSMGIELTQSCEDCPEFGKDN